MASHQEYCKFMQVATLSEPVIVGSHLRGNLCPSVPFLSPLRLLSR
jgi:hypothetical protein